ncbi:MAG TPA: ABC transporter substrate-binding protein [Brevundimonas sp.]|jgi:iron complex transport system substrate-binding protein|uniref:ABC transporter substrate-binding protein n=1 Tax=Brevundimonas sp. TaxID=1871086 RepID=UPI002DEB4383|nr:ABC transporter substrate-binding protein [Brevundimonas sp.]
MIRAAALAVAVAAAGCAAAPEADDGRLRVMSLDGCADQYVLAMVPEAELALSPRADDSDSYFGDAARSRRRVRPGLEAAVGFRPDVVVRQWGGDARLLAALRRRGVRIVEIGDASDLPTVRANVVRVAGELGRREAGLNLASRMDAQLDRAARTAGSGEPALYLTAAGWTSGPGTLVDAVMTAGGLRNATRAPGFGAVGLEQLALHPPHRFVLSFFDRPGSDRHGVGRHEVVRRAVAAGEAKRIPAALLSCPAWFTAEAVEVLAR